jgi:O-antigen/teichoic acid export membrane protein
VRFGVLMGIMGALGGLLSERLEIFFLGRFWTPAEVGFYSLAMTLAFHIRRLGPGALGEVLFPVIAKLEGQRDAWGVGHAYVEATRYLSMAGVPLALGGALCAPAILRLLFGPQYLPAAPALAMLFVVAGVLSLSHPAAAVILSQERHAFLLTTSLGLVVLNVALDLVLIPPYGAIGAAAANAVTQAVWLVLQTAFVARWLRVAPPLADVGRSLLAGAVAFAPAAGLTAWLASLGALAPLLSTVLALGLYPWALAACGALTDADIRRLQAVEAALPKAVRRATGPALRGLHGWARAPRSAS